MRRIVMPGGSGHVGTLLARHFHGMGDEVTVLSRRPRSMPWRVIPWDGRTPGEWLHAIDGCAVVINLTGRSVDCRYTAANRREILESRVDATAVIGRAIAQVATPPAVWLNASTATIYRHAFDRDMDEASGEPGGDEPGAPSTWRFSIGVAKAWERAFFDAATPWTRKVALRSAMVMSPGRGGVLDVLTKLVRFGLGGRLGSGRQYFSWIHGTDFTRAVEFLIQREDLEGCVNVCSPNPVPNRDFMSALRKAAGVRLGIPAVRWMLEIGAPILRTETELVLKSRRVVPGRLLDADFKFHFPSWPEAARDLLGSMNSAVRGGTPPPPCKL